jgi:hypothetical protein
VDRIQLESFDTTVVPVFVAITAENNPTAGDKTQGPVTEKPQGKEENGASGSRQEARRGKPRPASP